jgi:hypothetical protein
MPLFRKVALRSRARVGLAVLAAMVLGIGLAPAWSATTAAGTHPATTEGEARAAAPTRGAAAEPTAAQQLGMPESPRNLQVLPADMSTRAVIGVMRGFSGALGVRCTHCHVGDNPRDLSTVDFASDAMDTKQIARVMMRMVQRINDDMIEPGVLAAGRSEALEVRCATCHHGNSRPMTLQATLTETYRSDGLAAMFENYDQLRDRHYGGWVYDFSEGALLRLAQEFAAEDQDAAMAVVDKNLEVYPESASSYVTRATLQARAGDTDAALATLDQCLSDLADAGFCGEARERLLAQTQQR